MGSSGSTQGSSSSQKTSTTPHRNDLELEKLVSTCQLHVDSLVDQAEHMHACIAAQHDFLKNFVQKSSHSEGQALEGGAFGGTGGGSNVDTGYTEADETGAYRYRYNSGRQMDAKSTRQDEDREMDAESHVSNEMKGLDWVSTKLMAFIQNTSYQRADNLRAEVKKLDNFVRDKVNKYFPSLKSRSVLQRPSIRYSVTDASSRRMSKTSNVQNVANKPTGPSLRPSVMATDTNGYYQEQIDLLRKSLQEERENTLELNETNHKLEQLLDDEKRKYREIEDFVNRKEKEIITLNDTLVQNDRTIRRKNEAISKLNKQLDDRDKPSFPSNYLSWNRAQPRRKASALLFCQRQSDLLGTVCGEITKLLSDKFAMQNTDLTLTRCEGGSAIQEGIPVIVLCINASRLGTDVTNALAGLRLTPFVAVVILHHKDRHALPNQTSDRVLTAPEYKSLGGIYDMAFLSGKGVYQCDMNTTAVTNLVSFIDRFNTG